MFEYLNEKKQRLRERRQREQMFAKQALIERANAITFVLLAESGKVDEMTATEHSDLFADWASNIGYTVGALRRYNGALYRCIQSHTSLNGWTPDVSAALWAKVGDPSEEYPAWSAPIGAHDAYAIGDKVSHDGKKWVSVLDGNVWVPGVYGWSEEI